MISVTVVLFHLEYNVLSRSRARIGGHRKWEDGLQWRVNTHRLWSILVLSQYHEQIKYLLIMRRHCALSTVDRRSKNIYHNWLPYSLFSFRLDQADVDLRLENLLCVNAAHVYAVVMAAMQTIAANTSSMTPWEMGRRKRSPDYSRH